MTPKNYVIIGGSKGIGLGITQRLSSCGASVTVLSRTNETLTDLPNVSHVRFDVTKDDLDAELLPNRIDGLAYCPGSINLSSIQSVDPESIVEDFRLNVVGAIRSLQTSLPAMKVTGVSSVVLFSSVAVAQGMRMHASVAASKGAVEALARTLAAELAPTVRVNCIAPALTDTPLAARFLASPKRRIAMSEMYPLKRIGSVDDVAALAEFLLTDASSWITGQVIGVDGGLARLRS